MSIPTRIAVTGATGRVGHHLVDVLTERGREVVPIARARGVDVVTGDGLATALAGVDCIIDTATGPEPDEQAATAFFAASARNLQTLGERAGVKHIVVVSIIGTDRHTAGYGAAKAAHERLLADGPIPVTVVRAAQFHEFVAQLLDWGTQGEIGYVQKMRTQLVAARTVAETLADIATGVRAVDGPWLEIAGPREEMLVAAATLLAAYRGYPLKVEEVNDPTDPDRAVFETGGLLPGPEAILAGPTYEDWLSSST
jgi:uncharacterized protein YbjT (DUF2867 family)